jgi:hypothetical protein
MVGRNGRKTMGGRMVEKVEGITRGALPYAAAFSFPSLVIMNMQTTGFFYFKFVIMLKW